MPEHENGRPSEGGRMSPTPLKNTTSVPATPDEIVEPERCRECGHRITAQASVALGIGPECRRRLRAAAREAVAA